MDLFSNLQLLHEAAILVLVTTIYGRWRTITLDDRAAQSASYHDRHSRTKSPFYAGQTVSVLNDAKTLWLPATVIRQAAHGSYLVEVIS